MSDLKQIAEQKVARLRAAINLVGVDQVPLVGTADFWPVGYTGLCTMQEAYYDIDLLAECYKRTFSQWHQWDAFGAMMYSHGPFLDATGSTRYKIPGRELPADAEFQYPDQTLMDADEYLALIDDPLGFMCETVIPRLCTRAGSKNAYERVMALGKASLYLGQLGAKTRAYTELWNDAYGIPPLLKGFATRVPLDWIADALRGFQNGILDCKERPAQVQAACEALLPFLRDLILISAPQAGDYPLLFNPQHVSPFLSPKDYDRVYWPTFKRMMDAFVERGHKVWVFFENRQDQHLERLQDLPHGKIVAHLESTDLAKAKKVLGGKLCIAGGMPIKLLAKGTPQEVRDQTISVLKLFEDEPGFIMTTDATIPINARPENIQTWLDTMKEHGRRGDSIQSAPADPPSDSMDAAAQAPAGDREALRSWSTVRSEFGMILGDERVIADKWEDLERLALPLIYWLIR